MNSMNLGSKDDKTMLKQKLNILGKILSKGSEPLKIRKSIKDISKISQISHICHTEATQNKSSNLITDNSYSIPHIRKQVENYIKEKSNIEID